MDADFLQRNELLSILSIAGVEVEFVCKQFIKLEAETVLLKTNKFMSPTIFREKGYRFYFFSREEKRMHVHVVSGDGEAKFWLEPKIVLASNYHYSRRQLKEIELLVEVHNDELIGAWKQYFSN